MVMKIEKKQLDNIWLNPKCYNNGYLAAKPLRRVISKRNVQRLDAWGIVGYKHIRTILILIIKNDK